jgi:hypothetical protein
VRDEAGLDGDLAGALRRHHVEDVALDVFDFKVHRTRLLVHADRLRAGAVLDHAGIELRPGAPEERSFGGQVRIRVDHQDLRLRLRRLEIRRDLASPLVRPGRAAIGRERNGEHEDATVAHPFELGAQRLRFTAGLPRMQDAAAAARGLQSAHFVEQEIHARRDDQSVVRERGAASQDDGSLRSVDGRHVVLHYAHAVPLQPGVRALERLELPMPAEHEIGQRARGKDRLALDQGHLDGGGPQSQVLRCGRAAVAASHHDHARLGRAARRLAGRRQGGRGGDQLENLAPFHRPSCAAKYAASASIWRSL